MNENKWFKSNDILSVAGSTSLAEIISYYYDTNVPFTFSEEEKQKMLDIVLATNENGERIYKRISDLQNGSKYADKDTKDADRAYRWFYNFDLLDELRPYFDKVRNEKNHWENKNKILNEAKKVDKKGNRIYNTLSDLHKAVGVSISLTAKKIGIYDKLLKIVPIRNTRREWTEEDVVIESNRKDKNGNRIYKNVTDFGKNCSGAFRKAKELKILYTKCGFTKYRGLTPFNKKTALIESKQYLKRTDCFGKNARLYRYLSENGLLDIAFPK
jgi:hypothetical protein